ncbi:Glutamate-gated potassium channel [Granulibacter bethesdensis CGDNIH4]|nr:Glutamate-gated potassium channel [Granulibacter bethesdensis CGDNIH4]
MTPFFSNAFRRPLRSVFGLCFLLFSILAQAGMMGVVLPPAHAMAADKNTAEHGVINAGYFIDPPFVLPHQKNDHPAGLAIDLWDKTSQMQGWITHYHRYETIADLLSALERGEIDVGTVGLTISSQRMEKVIFSQPWFQTGLRMMIVKHNSTGLSRLLSELAASGHLRNYLLIFLAILVATLITAIMHRHVLKDSSPHWSSSLSGAFYDMMAMLTGNQTSGTVPERAGARIIAAIWLLCGVGIVAYVTSSITSVMTASEINQRVDNITELGHRPVSAMKGSIAMTFALDTGLNVHGYTLLSDAVDELIQGKTSAILGDASQLDYYIQQNPTQSLIVTGATLRPENLGFVMRPGFPMRDQIDRTILKLQEEKILSQMESAYFSHR